MIFSDIKSEEGNKTFHTLKKRMRDTLMTQRGFESEEYKMMLELDN